MSSYLDIDTLSRLVRIKRGNRGLRDIAKEIDNISPSTISRVENGKTPDIDTFLALCDWLEVPPTELIKNTEAKNNDNLGTLKVVIVQLPIDLTVANALIVLIEHLILD